MIQMCVYNSILAGRLGDCWLAPGRLLAGCTGRLWLAPGKAGPGKAGWPLGRLLLLAALGGCWLGCADLLNFGDFCAAAWRGEVQADADFLVRTWSADVIFRLPRGDLTGNGGLPL